MHVQGWEISSAVSVLDRAMSREEVCARVEQRGVRGFATRSNTRNRRRRGDERGGTRTEIYGLRVARRTDGFMRPRRRGDDAGGRGERYG